MRKKSLILVAFIAVSSTAAGQTARSIHRDAIVVDTHDDVISNQLTSGKNLARNEGDQFDLVKAKKGGLDVQVFSIWSDEKGDYALANREINTLNSLISRNPDKIALVRNAEELEQAVKAHKLAALIGVEGGHMINDRLDYIDSLYKRGMCYMTLTWNNSTSWASSAADESAKNSTLKSKGLSDFGKQVVNRMNKLGVMVDVSHVGEKTFYDAIAASSKPVIASHSSVYKLCPHYRNLKDEQLRAIAKTGGVVFVNFYSGFIDSTYYRKYQTFLQRHKSEQDSLSEAYGSKSRAEAEINRKYKDEVYSMRPPLSLLIDHIDYIAKLIGTDHVGIGADFEGAESYPRQMNDVSDYPLITSELLKRGYGREDIKKILGGNFIRVLRANAGR